MSEKKCYTEFDCVEFEDSNPKFNFTDFYESNYEDFKNGIFKEELKDSFLYTFYIASCNEFSKYFTMLKNIINNVILYKITENEPENIQVEFGTKIRLYIESINTEDVSKVIVDNFSQELINKTLKSCIENFDYLSCVFKRDDIIGYINGIEDVFADRSIFDIKLFYNKLYNFISDDKAKKKLSEEFYKYI